MLCVKIPTPPRDLKRIIAQNASKRGSSLSEDSQERDDFDNGPTHIDQSVRQNYKDYDVDMGITISMGGDQMAVGAETLRASIPSASVQRRFNGSVVEAQLFNSIQQLGTKCIVLFTATAASVLL